MELKARIAKIESGLAIQNLKVVKNQRPFLWCDPLIIHVQPSIQVETSNHRVDLRYAKCQFPPQKNC